MILRSGKYKGQRWTDVQQFDPGYIRWIRENRPEMLKFSQPKAKKLVDEDEDLYIQPYKDLPIIDPKDAF